MTEKPGIKLLDFQLSNDKRTNKIVYPGLFLLTFVILFIILSWKYLPSKSLKEGVIANRDILAPHTDEVEDKQATLQAKNEAMNSVKPVYKINPFILNQADSQIKSQFNIFARLRDAKKSNRQLEAKELKSQVLIPISDESLHTLANLDKNTLEQVEIMTIDLTSRIMKQPIRENDEKTLKEARKQARKMAREFTLPPKIKDAVADLVSEAIRPNARIDWDETGRLRQVKKDQVRPVMITIHKGQVIVEKNKIVTPRKLEILESIGLHRSTFNLPAISGIALFILISILIVWIYICLFSPALAHNPRHLLLLILITISTVLICRLMVQVNPYWAPIPIAAILITVLINPGIAMVITAYLSLVIGLLTGEINFIAVSLIIGTVAVLSSYRVHRRMDLIATSVIIFLVNIFSILIFSLINGEAPQMMAENLFYGGINGFGSGILAVGLLPVLEYLFNITTSIKLLEISNQSEPLMKRLLLEAPGTYHHSVIVGNLAESAAEIVGEDPLLCRVGSYYHDIGKLRRPYFFIENQLGSENPHDKLSPNLSALVILSHIKDGLEFGREQKLPEPIMEIINQHHGTSIIAYFYHQAKQSDKDYPHEEDFRYPGPKPRSKAAAIVMLADSVEAAARTLNKPTPTKIEALVRQIVNNNLKDGQLDESPLSLKEINEIIKSFTRILTGIYHQRIEYPDKMMEEMGPPVPMPAKVTHIKTGRIAQ